MARSSVRPGLAAGLLAVGLVVTACAPSGGTAAGGAPAQRTAANGIADEPVAQVLARVRAAVAASSSVQLVGSMGGQSFRAVIGRSAADVRLSVASKGTAEVRVVGAAYYLRADRAFLTAQVNAAAARQLAGRWLKVPADGAGSAAGWASVRALSKEGFVPTGKATKGAPTVVDGQRVLPITDAEGTLYVLLDGQPLPLKEVNTKGDSKGTIVFTAWNEPVHVTAPPRSGVVDTTRPTGG